MVFFSRRKEEHRRIEEMRNTPLASRSFRRNRAASPPEWGHSPPHYSGRSRSADDDLGEQYSDESAEQDGYDSGDEDGSDYGDEGVSDSGADDVSEHSEEGTNGPGKEVVIAVMGITGSGKTSFIKNVTGYDIDISDGLFSGLLFHHARIVQSSTHTSQTPAKLQVIASCTRASTTY